MTKTVVCPKCGAKNLPTLDFCGSCGADLESVVVSDVPDTESYDQVLSGLADKVQEGGVARLRDDVSFDRIAAALERNAKATERIYQLMLIVFLLSLIFGALMAVIVARVL